MLLLLKTSTSTIKIWFLGAAIDWHPNMKFIYCQWVEKFFKIITALDP